VVAKKKPTPKDTLSAYTGHDALWWMRFVQKQIARCSGPVQKDGHSRMTSYDWVGRVIGELFKTAFPNEGRYDPNMRIAYLTAFVLATWFSRVQHSKTFDPRRPKKDRQNAYVGWRTNVAALIDTLIDESRDPRVFNGIPLYENPFDPKTKSGKYR
jgi:hypothetical protein